MIVQCIVVLGESISIENFVHSCWCSGVRRKRVKSIYLW